MKHGRRARAAEPRETPETGVGRAGHSLKPGNPIAVENEAVAGV